MTVHDIKVFSYASCRIRFHTGLQCTKWQYKALDSAWNNIRGKFTVPRMLGSRKDWQCNLCTASILDLWISRKDFVKAHCQISTKYLQNNLKTSEKKSGTTVILFERSRFQLFSLKYSNKSVQSSSCERPKTAQQTLFLSFEINNCFPIAVQRRSFVKKSVKLACHMVNSNIGNVKLHI